jgi:hypothetical protein
MKFNPFEIDKKTEAKHELMLATHEMLETLARESLAAEFRKQEDHLRQYKVDHEQDLAAYAFDCKKHGDFLTVFITRLGGFCGDNRETEKYSTSINLSNCSRINLSEGHAPDRDGANRFSYKLVDAGGKERKRSDGNSPAPDGYKYAVSTPDFAHPDRYLFSSGGASIRVGGECYISHRSFCGEYFPYHITTEVTNAARAAQDDEILFLGVGAVHAPFSLGKAVHERILAELEKVSA